MQYIYNEIKYEGAYAVAVPIYLIYHLFKSKATKQVAQNIEVNAFLQVMLGWSSKHGRDNNLVDKIIAGKSYNCMHAMFKVFCNRKLNVE